MNKIKQRKDLGDSLLAVGCTLHFSRRQIALSKISLREIVMMMARRQDLEPTITQSKALSNCRQNQSVFNISVLLSQDFKKMKGQQRKWQILDLEFTKFNLKLSSLFKVSLQEMRVKNNLDLTQVKIDGRSQCLLKILMRRKLLKYLVRDLIKFKLLLNL